MLRLRGSLPELGLLDLLLPESSRTVRHGFFLAMIYESSFDAPHGPTFQEDQIVTEMFHRSFGRPN